MHKYYCCTNKVLIIQGMIFELYLRKIINEHTIVSISTHS